MVRLVPVVSAHRSHLYACACLAAPAQFPWLCSASDVPCCFHKSELMREGCLTGKDRCIPFPRRLQFWAEQR